MKTFLVLLISLNLFAEVDCSAKVEDIIMKKGYESANQVVDEAKVLIEYLQFNSSLPNRPEDLAKILEVDLKDLKKRYPRKKTSQEIVRDMFELAFQADSSLLEPFLKDLRKESADYFSKAAHFPPEDMMREFTKLSDETFDMLFPDMKALKERLGMEVAQTYPKKFDVAKNLLVREYIKFVKERKVTPSFQQFANHMYPDHSPEDAFKLLSRVLIERIDIYSQFTRNGKKTDLVTIAKEQGMSEKKLRVYLTELVLEVRDIDEMKSLVAKKFDVRESSLQMVRSPENIVTGGVEEIKELAMVKNRNAFKDVMDSTIYTPARKEALVDAIRTKERLIVSSVNAGQGVEKELLDSLLYYADQKNADIILIPANMEMGELDPVLLNNPRIHILTHAIEISEDLAIDNIKIMPKAINPLTGLDTIGNRGMSRIVGAARRVLKSIAVFSNELHPHFNATVGSISTGLHQSKREIQDRTAKIAQNNHFKGAMLLERDHAGRNQLGLPTESTWHMRYLSWSPIRKGIHDLLTFFSSTGTQVKERVLAMIPGDIHVMSTSAEFFQKFRAELKEAKPYYVVLHDLLDGASINHHESKNKLLSSLRAAKGEFDLMNEVKAVGDVLVTLLRENPDTKFVVLRSNHNDWLSRWTAGRLYEEDNLNRILGDELFRVMHDANMEPLEYLLKEYILPDSPEIRNRVIFHDDEIALKLEAPIGGKKTVQHHGDKGANGARGSHNTFIRGADSSVNGHTHGIHITDDTTDTGTGTGIILPYNKGGASSWRNGLTRIFLDGTSQVNIMKDGRFYREAEDISPEAIFDDNGIYPNVIPNASDLEPDAVPIGDQYKVD